MVGDGGRVVGDGVISVGDGGGVVGDGSSVVGDGGTPVGDSGSVVGDGGKVGEGVSVGGVETEGVIGATVVVLVGLTVGCKRKESSCNRNHVDSLMCMHASIVMK